MSNVATATKVIIAASFVLAGALAAQRLVLSSLGMPYLRLHKSEDSP